MGRGSRAASLFVFSLFIFVCTMPIKPVVEEVESTGPSMWEVAAHHEIPETHWEYHMRKHGGPEGNGDAAYRNLAYVPVSKTMPVSGERDCCDFMWTKKKPNN